MGAVVIVLLAFVSCLAPLLATHDPIKIRVQDDLLPPGKQYLLGTDHLGRDVFSRTLFGLRLTLMAGVSSVILAAICGGLWGTIAGVYGGWVDQIAMRLTDIMLAFPALLLALTIVSISRPGMIGVTIAVGISMVPTFTRMVRASILSVMENEYIGAARAIGCPARRIILRHVWPNVFGPFIAIFTLTLAWGILATSSLSFLGMGVQPPTSELGSMLAYSRDFIRQAWWIPTFPGLTIMVAVLTISILGDGLRDALDPTLRN